MDLSDLKEVLDIIEVAKQLTPIADKAADAILEYGPAFRKVFDSLMSYHRQTEVDSFNFYISNGFTREESLALIINAKVALRNVFNKISYNTTKERV